MRALRGAFTGVLTGAIDRLPGALFIDRPHPPLEKQMTISRRAITVGSLGLLTTASFSTIARAGWGELNLGEGLEEFWLATDAYIFGYPLVTMEMTRRIMTNVAAPEGTRAPMGQFVKAREYPNASFRDVTAPNADTLYTTAWIDVGAEPWVLSIPDMKDRYALFPMLDGWTTVFQVPGKRTTGTAAQTYAITAPNWKGTLPSGVKEYKSPTNMVWILGRIYCTGTPEDYKAVHELQDQCKLVPLSAYGKTYTPPAGKADPSIDMKTAVREQVNRMDAKDYFTLLAQLMKTNPPPLPTAPNLPASPRSAWWPARTSMPASSTRASPSAFLRSPSTASWRSSSSTKMLRTSTAGPSRPRPASTAPTT
jgi:hypothetical protein